MVEWAQLSPIMPTCQWSLNHELYYKGKYDPGVRLKSTNWLLCLYICGSSFFFVLLIENARIINFLSSTALCLQPESLLLSQKCLHLLCKRELFLMLSIFLTWYRLTTVLKHAGIDQIKCFVKLFLIHIPSFPLDVLLYFASLQKRTVDGGGEIEWSQLSPLLLH